MTIALSPDLFRDLSTYLEGHLPCNHTLCHTVAWLRAQNIENLHGTLEKLIDLGGHCDCEVLLNVDEATWNAEREKVLTGPDLIGDHEWQQFISTLLVASGIEQG